MFQPPSFRQMLWMFARFDGRISRQAYWLANFALVAVLGVFMRPEIEPETGEIALNLGEIGLPLVLLAMVSSLAIGAKRLHDCGLSAIFVVVLILPVISLIATIVIGVIPGTTGANRYGDRPNIVP